MRRQRRRDRQSSGGDQLIEHPRVGVRTIGGDLIGGRPNFQDPAKNRRVADASRLLGDSAVDDLPRLVDSAVQIPASVDT